MYKLENNVQVNLAAEIQAIADFLPSRWENVENPQALAQAVADAALYDGRFWFNQYDISEALHGRADARRELLEALEGEGGSLSLYDQPCRMLSNMAMAVSKVHEAGQTVDGKWDFGDKADAVARKVQAALPWLSRAKPLGYAELAANYSDFDGQREYCESDKWSVDADDFAGADTAGACVSAFPHQVALPYVMYDDKCQGRRPPRALVSAIYGHFLRIAEYINAQAMLQAIKELPLMDAEPQPVWELDLKSDNLLVRALLSAAQRDRGEDAKSPKEQYEESEVHRRAFAQKTPEEQQAIRAANAVNLSELIASLTKPHADNSYELQRKQEIQKCRDILLAAT